MKLNLWLMALLLFLPFTTRPLSAMTVLALRDQCNAATANTNSITTMQAAKSTSCVAYVEGVIDGMMLAKARLCVPNEVSVFQQAFVVSKYIDNHPEDLHLSPSALVVKAIGSAWPCK